MQKIEIKSVDLGSAVKIGFWLGLIIGLIQGLLGALVLPVALGSSSMMMPNSGFNTPGASITTTGFGFMGIVLLVVVTPCLLRSDGPSGPPSLA